MRISDWSSVVCSSDLQRLRASLAAALFRGLTPACAERKPDKRQAAHRPVAAAQHQGASDEQGIRHPTGERKRAGKAGTAEGAAAVGDPAPRTERRPLLRSRPPGRLRGSDRKSVAWGKSVSSRVELGARRIIKTNKT